MSGRVEKCIVYGRSRCWTFLRLALTFCVYVCDGPWHVHVQVSESLFFSPLPLSLHATVQPSSIYTVSRESKVYGKLLFWMLFINILRNELPSVNFTFDTLKR